MSKPCAILVCFLLAVGFVSSREHNRLTWGECKQKAEDICNITIDNADDNKDHSILSCIHEHEDEIPRECIRHLRRNLFRGVERNQPDFEACQKEFALHCPDANTRRAHRTCLLKNKDSLSPECVKQLRAHHHRKPRFHHKKHDREGFHQQKSEYW